MWKREEILTYVEYLYPLKQATKNITKKNLLSNHIKKKLYVLCIAYKNISKEQRF